MIRAELSSREEDQVVYTGAMEEDKAFFSELYTEDSIAAFEKLNGVGYIGSQGKAFTEARVYRG